jgi:periplasmic divalent cation tolerance protein
MNTILVYCTTSSSENASTIGKKVVEERLAACVNIFDGIQSIYHWQGSLCEENETAFILKTREHLAEPLIKRIKELHPYSCPCIITLPVAGGNPDFLNWIGSETRK